VVLFAKSGMTDLLPIFFCQVLCRHIDGVLSMYAAVIEAFIPFGSAIAFLPRSVVSMPIYP
jgi:hypothetical protein